MTSWDLPDCRPGSRRLLCWLACTALTLPAAGCATFWDEVFSRERDLYGYFRPPDPLVVIYESNDGERRAKALASLKEPAQHGGDQKQQDTFIQILTTAAKTDRDPLCRLGAIQALGHFKDERAARALEKVYEEGPLPFTRDFNAMIKLQALRSLEMTGNEGSRELLIKVARQPGPPIDAPSGDRQQTQDEKLVAIRALRIYRQPDSLDTLVSLLETEKDAALRDRAHQSLQTATGKSLPPEAAAWRDALAGQPVTAQQPNLIDRVSGWFTKQ